MNHAPLVVEFDVGVASRHAFDTWVTNASTWWPPTHTITGSAGTKVVFEPFVGGRIFERSPDGVEHDWGEILAWDPPRRVTYLWHLFFERIEATEVEVTFTPKGNGTTVRIEQTGWERLGEQAEQRRTRTHSAWASITGLFVDALGAEDPASASDAHQ